LRGRQPGEVPALLEARLRSQGVPAECISQHLTDGEAVDALIGELQADDLALLFIHEDAAALLARLTHLADA
jgi:hypothetical protein